MSGASIPYHLRPHKAVDRRIFIDLLGRIERWRPLTNYVYLSMGAYPLEDHKLVHRILGITKLVAFDMDKAIVARQTFNKPLSSCQCLEKTSAEVVDSLDKLLSDCGFGNPEGVIVWLDYTDPKKLGEQIREFEALLDRLSVGDVVRVTVNVHPNELSQQISETPVPSEVRRTKQFEALKRRIKEYLPSWTTADHMTVDHLPLVISESFAAAAAKALPAKSENAFRPLSLVRYADGVQMLSICGVVAKRTDEGEMLQRLDLQSWPFASDNWSNIHQLVVPNLTVRERLYLEREIVTKSVEDIVKGLGFESAGGVPIINFIENYKNYYRFYPTLLAVDV